MGRNALAAGQRREEVHVRVAPATMEFLKSLKRLNIGRAIDQVVEMLRSEQKRPT